MRGIICFLLIVIGQQLFAQQQYIPIKKGSKWGVIDNDGKEILPLVYEPFTSGNYTQYLICKRNNNQGVFNFPLNKFIVPERNWKIEIAANASFKCTTLDSSYFFSNDGKFLISDAYTIANKLNDSIFFFKQKSAFKYVNINSKKTFLDTCDANHFSVQYLIYQKYKEQLCKIYNFDFKLVAEIKDSIKSIFSVTDLLFVYRNKFDKYVLYDLINNKKVGDTSYTTYSFWSNNSNFLKLINGNKSVLMNLADNSLSQLPPFDTIAYIKNKMYVIRDKNKYGLADSSYNQLLSAEFEYIKVLNKPFVGVKKFGLYAIFNTVTKKTTEYLYDDIEDEANNVLVYEINSKKGLLNSKLMQLTKPIYDEIIMNENTVDLIVNGKTETRTINSKGELFEKLENIHEFVIKGKFKPKASWIDDNIGLRNNDPNDILKCNCYAFVSKLQTKTGTVKAPVIKYSLHQVHFQSRILYDTCKGIYDSKKYYRRANLCDFRVSNVVGAMSSKFEYGYVDKDLHFKATLSFFKATKKVKEPILFASKFAYGKSAVCVGQAHKNTKMNVYKENEHYHFLKNAFLKEIKWGFVDTLGNILIEPKYEDVKDFNPKSAIVALENPKLKKHKLWGLINQKGETILPIEYDDIISINDTILRVYKHRFDYKLLNNNVEYITSQTFDQIKEHGENKWPVQKNSKWGFVKTSGQMLTEFEFDKAITFREGLAGVKLGKKWGYIDSTGKIAIKTNFNFVDNFYRDRAFVKRGSGYELINKSGDYISTKKFAHYIPFYNTVTFAKLHRKKFRLIDLNGNFISKKRFKTVSKFNIYNTAVVKKYRKKEFLIDTTGKKLSDKYKKIHSYQNSLALVKKHGKYGFIDTLGKEKIKVKFNHALAFSENKAIVYETVVLNNLKKARVYNIIDTAGNYLTDNINLLNKHFDNKQIRDSILSLRYFPFSENLSILTTQQCLMVINSDFEVLYKILFEEKVKKFEPFRGGIGIVNNEHFVTSTEKKYLYKFELATHLTDSIILAKINNKVGLFDSKLNEIVKPIYRSITLENNGMFKLQLFETVGMVENDGKIKIPCIFDRIERVETSNNHIYVHYANEIGCARKDGTWIYGKVR